MSDAAAEALPESPFQGLEPFSEDDRKYFFGREEDQQTIGANLVTAPLTVLYGASGVGKTSVLMAGVIPFVRKQPNVAVVLYRNWQDSDAFRQLKAAIVKEAGADGVDVEQPLDRVLVEAGRRTRKTIAVIFDQFEEYLLYNPPESESGRRFDAEFARAVNREDIDANFVISIREDAIAKLDRFQAYIPDVLGNYLRLDHLDLAGARRAIEKPLAHYNEVAAAEKKVTIEPALVDAVLEQVRIGRVNVGAQGKGRIVADSGRVETPFLQMVLMKVWTVERAQNSSTLRAATLAKLGGSEKIVRDHVESVMASLRGSQRHAAAAIFDRLVTPSGSKIAYNADDLRNFAGKYSGAVDALLERLSDRHVRILRAVAPLGESPQIRYEIFHDVLSSAVLNWRTQYLRDRNQKRVIAYLAVIVAVTFGVLYWLEKQQDARAARERARTQHEADVLKQISDLQARVNAMNAGATKGQDPNLLKQTAALYANIGDVKGQITTLRQLGDAAVDNRKYADAIAAYDKALKIATNRKDQTDLKARRSAAQGGRFRAAGDADRAADAYYTAANAFAANGQAADAASMMTKSATAAQDAGDLDAALARWQWALNVQKQLGDTDGQARSLRGIDAVNQLKEKKSRGEKPRQVTLAPPPEGQPCLPSTLQGYWTQYDKKKKQDVAIMWRFDLKETKAGTALHVARTDGVVTGDLVLQRNAFAGSLRSIDGEAWKDVRFAIPDQSTKCQRVETNQSWFFEKTEPASAK